MNKKEIATVEARHRFCDEQFVPNNKKSMEIKLCDCGLGDNEISGRKVFRCDDLGDKIGLYYGDIRNENQLYLDSNIILIPKDLCKIVGRYLIKQYGSISK